MFRPDITDRDRRHLRIRTLPPGPPGGHPGCARVTRNRGPGAATIDVSLETGCGKSTILSRTSAHGHVVFAYDDRDQPNSSVHYYSDCPLFRKDTTTLVSGATQLTLPKYVSIGQWMSHCSMVPMAIPFRNSSITTCIRTYDRAPCSSSTTSTFRRFTGCINSCQKMRCLTWCTSSGRPLFSAALRHRSSRRSETGGSFRRTTSDVFRSIAASAVPHGRPDGSDAGAGAERERGQISRPFGENSKPSASRRSGGGMLPMNAD